MKNLYFSLLLSSLVFSSCKKILSDKEPCELKQIVLTTNSPVIVGWPIKILTPLSSVGKFNWVGPNGNITFPQNYEQNNVEILNSSFSDSGTYKLEYTTPEGCLTYRNFVDIKIIPAPLPTCQVPNNTSTSNIVNVGSDTYTNFSFTNNVISAYPYTSSSENAMTFRFRGSLSPKPGVYKTTQNIYSIANDNQVSCNINKFPAYNFTALDGQDVYVNKINGKLQLAFCNVQFSNPIGSTVIKISTKITQP